MASNKTKVLSIRISNEAYAAIELEAERTGRRIKDIIELFGLDISEGRIRCNGDSVTPTDEYLGGISDDGEYEELGFSGVLHLLRERGYPDSAIRQINERHRRVIRDSGRYNSGKVGEDWGC